MVTTIWQSKKQTACKPNIHPFDQISTRLMETKNKDDLDILRKHLFACNPLFAAQNCLRSLFYSGNPHLYCLFTTVGYESSSGDVLHRQQTKYFQLFQQSLRSRFKIENIRFIHQRAHRKVCQIGSALYKSKKVVILMISR